MKLFWEILNKIIVIALILAFIRWYFKDHFGKYFIFFWLNTIVAIVMYINQKSNDTPHNNRSEAKIWNEQNY